MSAAGPTCNAPMAALISGRALSRVRLRGKGAHRDTLYFKKDFEAAAAEFASKTSQGRHARLEPGQQLSPEWHKLRDARLTASAFSNALG